MKLWLKCDDAPRATKVEIGLDNDVDDLLEAFAKKTNEKYGIAVQTTLHFGDIKIREGVTIRELLEDPQYGGAGQIGTNPLRVIVDRGPYQAPQTIVLQPVISQPVQKSEPVEEESWYSYVRSDMEDFKSSRFGGFLAQSRPPPPIKLSSPPPTQPQLQSSAAASTSSLISSQTYFLNHSSSDVSIRKRHIIIIDW